MEYLLINSKVLEYCLISGKIRPQQLKGDLWKSKECLNEFALKIGNMMTTIYVLGTYTRWVDIRI